MPNSTWKPVVGHEDGYMVSDTGQIWSHHSKRILKPRVNPSGHIQAAFSQNSKRTDRYVHQLVLEAFVGPCPDGMECCHNDGDPANNNLSNLRWDTHSNNMHDRVLHGTCLNTNKTHCDNGHEFNLENTYVTEAQRGCRVCRNDTATRWRQANRERSRAIGRAYLQRQREARARKTQ